MSFSDQSLQTFFNRETDLSNCDQEPIHIISSIQPFGVLVSLDITERRILQVSQNCGLLGYTPEDVLGIGLETLCDGKLKDICESKQNPWLEWQGKQFYVHVVETERHLVVEMILQPQKMRTEDVADSGEIEKLRHADTERELLESATRMLYGITGYDRVMLYKFDEHYNGTVAAEQVTEGLTPYIGLCYPASDVPKQVRALYRLNPVRFIPDVNFEPVSLQPEIDPLTKSPLDMSLCWLRGVSPIHIEYLNNMNAQSSMSVSILINDRLWGLIAFHHNAPKTMTESMWEQSRQIAEILQQQIPELEEYAYQQELLEMETAKETLLAEVDKESDEKVFSLLREVVPSTGVMVGNREHYRAGGKALSPDVFSEMLEILSELEDEKGMFFTHNMLAYDPMAMTYKDVASGVLAGRIDEDNWVVWLREERIKTVSWAGDPAKPDESLTPRKSFDVFREVVKLTSEPWKRSHVDLALALCKNKLFGRYVASRT